MAAEFTDRQGHLFCTIGRMNPPTTGHMRVIEELFKSALTVGGHVVVFLSDTSGREKMTLADSDLGKIPKENPLLCETKRQILLKMVTRFISAYPQFGAVPFEIICGKPVPLLFGYVARTRPEKVSLFLGNEPEKVELGETFRSGFFDEAVPRFTQKDNENQKKEKIQAAIEKTRSRRETYGGIGLSVHFMDRPPGSVSATMVRNYVRAPNKPRFNALYEDYLEQENKNSLFTNIHEGMMRIERNVHAEKVEKESARTSTKKSKSKAKNSPNKLLNVVNKMKNQTNKNRRNSKASKLASRRAI
jgi:hypothetical protein